MTRSARRRGGRPDAETVTAWFGDMVDHCHEYATARKERGGKIVGIMCEYTPREIIMAAGAAPVCLCGGDADMIPAAEENLPANLCPLVKSTYGYLVKHENPFLEMADLVVAETTCDAKKKMYELMAADKPMYVLELPQKPDDRDAFEHWVRELRKLKRHLESRFGVKITPRKIRAAIRAMNEERSLKLRLAEMMKADSPPMTGRELLDMKSLISCLPGDMARYRQAVRLFPSRRKRPKAASLVRVLLTGVPLPHCAERVMDLIESKGGLVVCQENCTGIKPLTENVPAREKDPIRALAKKYFHLPCSVMTSNDRRFDLLRELVADYKPECVVELVWHACLTYDVESHQVRKLAEETFGLPYLKIDTDYSPSDSGRIAVRLQALFETARKRARPAAAGAGPSSKRKRGRG